MRHDELFGRAFLGRAAVPLPAPGGPPVEEWFPFDEGAAGKHSADVADRCRRAGRRPGQLGELRVRVTRGDAAGEEATGAMPTPATPAMATPPKEREASPPRAHRDRLRRAVAAPVAALRELLPARSTSSEGETALSDDDGERSSDDASPRPHRRRRARAATHVHVAVVAARGLLPSDLKAAAAAPGAAASAASSAADDATSDPYCAVRLLPGVPEERHTTRVAYRTLNPLWEVRRRKSASCAFALTADAYRAPAARAGGAHLPRGARHLRRRGQGACFGCVASFPSMRLYRALL